MSPVTFLSGSQARTGHNAPHATCAVIGNARGLALGKMPLGGGLSEEVRPEELERISHANR